MWIPGGGTARQSKNSVQRNVGKGNMSRLTEALGLRPKLEAPRPDLSENEKKKLLEGFKEYGRFLKKEAEKLLDLANKAQDAARNFNTQGYDPYETLALVSLAKRERLYGLTTSAMTGKFTIDAVPNSKYDFPKLMVFTNLISQAISYINQIIQSEELRRILLINTSDTFDQSTLVEYARQLSELKIALIAAINAIVTNENSIVEQTRTIHNLLAAPMMIELETLKSDVNFAIRDTSFNQSGQSLFSWVRRVPQLNGDAKAAIGDGRSNVSYSSPKMQYVTPDRVYADTKTMIKVEQELREVINSSKQTNYPK